MATNEVDFINHISSNREHLTSVTEVQRFQLHYQPRACFSCQKQMKRNNLFCEFVTTTYDESNVIGVQWYTICKKCMLKLPDGFYGYVSGKLRNDK